jgi:hypothetical protein
VRIEPSAAEALVPDDFVVRAAPTATLLMGGAECGDARTTGEQGRASFGWSSIVVEPPEEIEPDVVIDGPAGALDAWLWHRGDESELSVVGDAEVRLRFLSVVEHPIN